MCEPGGQVVLFAEACGVFGQVAGGVAGQGVRETVRGMRDCEIHSGGETIIYTAKVEGRTEGKAEGLAEGEAKGRAEGKTDVARAMKAKGLEISLISELTGLSEEEIQRL